MPELKITFQNVEGDSSDLKGSSNATQSSLNAWLKEGGKAEKSM